MVSELDPAFVQDPDHRPSPAVGDAGAIPLIDLSPLSCVVNPVDAAGAARGSSLAALMREVEAAARDWGFFQVVNHGVPVDVLERFQAAARAFFALPAEEKLRVRRDVVNPLGYYESEHTKNVRDWKEVFDFMADDDDDDEEVVVPPSPGQSSGDRGTAAAAAVWKNQWPESPPELREAARAYAREVENLASKLLEVISLTLNLPAKRLNSFFHGRPQSSFVRVNHYPPCPAPHLALGVGRHKDSGALTVLLQDDVGGLDVRRKSDGRWVRVKPIPGSFVINVGDIIQVWSNDRYESAEHRVSVNSQRGRFSIPFFFNPTLRTTVCPLEEMVDEDNPPRYEAYSWCEFVRRRRTGDFTKLAVENIQISHFKNGE